MAGDSVLLRVRAIWDSKDVQKGLKSLERDVKSLNNRLRAAMRYAIPGTGALAGAGLIGGLTMLTRSVLQLTMEFQRAQFGLASILASYNDVIDAQGRVVTGAERFVFLLGRSKELLKAVREEAAKTVITAQELMVYTAQGMGYALRKGLTPEQATYAISRIAVASRVLGLLPGYQTWSEIRAMLTGQYLRTSQIAQALGITAKDIQQRHGEEFFRYLLTALKGFEEAARQFAKTFQARWQAFINEVQLALIEIGEAIVPLLGEWIADIRQAIRNWRESGGMNNLKVVVRGIVAATIEIGNMLGQVIKFLRDNPWLSRILTDIAAFAAGAWAGGKIGRLLGPKGAIIFSILGGTGSLVAAEKAQAAAREATANERFMQYVLDLIRRRAVPKGEPMDKAVAAGVLVQRMITESAAAEGVTLTAGDITRIQKALDWMVRTRMKPPETPVTASWKLRPLPLQPEEEKVKKAKPVDTQREAERAQKAFEKWREEAAEWVYRVGREPIEERFGNLIAFITGTPMFAPIFTNLFKRRMEELEEALEQSQKSEKAFEQQIEKIAEQVYRAGREPIEEKFGTAFAFWTGVPMFAPVFTNLFKRKMEEIEEARKRAEDASREFERWIQEASDWVYRVGREPIEEKLGTTLALFMGVPPFAPIFTRLFRRRMEEVTEAAERRQELLEFGLPWATALGYPEAQAAQLGKIREQLMKQEPILEAMITAAAKAQEEMRKRWRQFWEDVRELASSSFRNAFVDATTQLMRNIGQWRTIFRDFFRAIQDMVRRAIAEVIYERFVRRTVETAIDWLIGALGGGKGGKGGQKLGALGGAQLGFLVGGPVGAIAGAIISSIFKFQHGGTLRAGQIALVGESGPELVVSKNTAAVLSSQRVIELLSRLGNSANARPVNIYINDSGDYELARRVGREVTRAMRRSRF